MHTLYIIFFVLLTQLLFPIEAILLFGPPGSGKGTFGEFAKEKGYMHISAGDLIGDEINCRTEIGLAIEAIVARGDFIDPAIMFQLIKDRVLDCAAKSRPFIIDGYGRTVADGTRLLDFLHTIDAKPRALFLDASDATCKERILTRLVCSQCHWVDNQKMGCQLGQLCPYCQEAYLEVRINDTAQVIDKRLKQYREELQPCYSKFLINVPSISYNTDRNLEDCLIYYNSLLEEWK